MSKPRVKWKKILEVCKRVYTPLTLGCIIYFVFINREVLTGLYSNARPVFLVYAVLVEASRHLLAPIYPKLILLSFNYSLPYKELLKIHITRLPARYLPGGVWHTVGRLADYNASGISKKHLSFLAFFETVFPIPFSFFIGGTLLWLYSPGTLANSLEVISSVASLVILLFPFFLFVWKPFKKISSSRNTLFYIGVLLLSFIFWFLAAGSFIFYFNSVSFDNTVQHSLFTLAGTYFFSWGTGYISIFAPQGIGVFEVVAGKLIDLPLTLGSTVAFLAGFRLIALMADFLICFSYFLIRKKWN